jgi:hypothetical protein
MNIKTWMQNQFGDTDTETLLDESQYSRTELRKDKQGLQQALNQLESELDDHGTRYQHLLEKGANAGSLKKQQFAQKAKFEKKKYQIKKKKYKTKSTKLGTIISIEGMREILSMHEEESYAVDELFDDEHNAQELQAQVMDQMAEFGLEMEDMEEVQEALDVEILGQDFETEASEELEIMEEIQAGDLSREQVEIDAEATEGTVTDDDSFDIEDSQTSL